MGELFELDSYVDFISIPEILIELGREKTFQGICFAYKRILENILNEIHNLCAFSDTGFKIFQQHRLIFVILYNSKCVKEFIL